jgi:hypothetical protein
MARKSATVAPALPATAAPLGKARKATPKPAPEAKPEKAAEKKPAPVSPLSAKYAPALTAIVTTLVTTAKAAASAGLDVAARLAEAMAMNPHEATGHQSATAWAHALLSEACPMAGSSTVYAWIEAGVARTAVVAAGMDPAIFPMDTLRVIGAKSVTGQDPTRMADLAKAMAKDEGLRNGAGKIDPRKARASVKGSGPSVSLNRGEKITALIRKARSLAGTTEGALDLLRDAVDRMEENA